MKNQITNLLNHASSDVINEFFNSEFGEEANRWDGDEIVEFRKKLEDAGIKAKHEDNHGGEGEGEDYWSVYSFTKGDDTAFVKFLGWYYSYDGSTFDDWFFVAPEPRTITVYERIAK